MYTWKTHYEINEYTFQEIHCQFCTLEVLGQGRDILDENNVYEKNCKTQQHLSKNIQHFFKIMVTQQVAEVFVRHCRKHLYSTAANSEIVRLSRKQTKFKL